MTDTFTLLVPLWSLLLGAFLQFMFTRAAEVRKQHEVLQNQSYVDYLRSVAQLAHSRTSQSAEAAMQAAADAKARIAIYGTKSAIAALAKFEDTGANLRTEEGVRRFVDVAASMRRADASSADLRLVLFGPNSSPVDKPGDLK